MINGQGPFELVIDTGSSQTILFTSVGKKLGLTPEPGADITIHGIAASVTSHPFKLKELALSGERVADLPIAILDDPSSAEDEPDGVLGIDVLERYFLAFNSESRRFELFPRGAAPQPYAGWPGTAMMPRRLRGLRVDFWFVEARYAGYPATTLVDLGAGVSILTWELARHLVNRKDMPSKNAEEVRDALGKGFPAFRLEGLPVELARQRWRKEIALVADVPVFAILDMAGRPSAIVGAGLLKNNSFALDFEHRRLHIAPGR
ncbi:MAG: retropepsin-like aspartic protease [Alphaproteobacteria bacterium]